MSDTFLAYLRNERDRLNLALEQAQSAGQTDEVAILSQQRRIVEDQLARWTRDLAQEAIAA